MEAIQQRNKNDEAGEKEDNWYREVLEKEEGRDVGSYIGDDTQFLEFKFCIIFVKYIPKYFILFEAIVTIFFKFCFWFVQFQQMEI